MQKSNQSRYPMDGVRGIIKTAEAKNGGTKGHSKPGTGATHAGPPPRPQPKKNN